MVAAAPCLSEEEAARMSCLLLDVDTAKRKHNFEPASFVWRQMYDEFHINDADPCDFHGG